MQDPSYPVYVDSSVIMGMTDGYDESSKGFGKLEYMVCRPENDFFPDLSKVKRPSHSPSMFFKGTKYCSLIPQSAKARELAEIC